jgi:hypothetical protein
MSPTWHPSELVEACLATAHREEPEKPDLCASGGGENNIEQDDAILRRLRHRCVVQLHEILAMRKKVHFKLDLVTSGELFSLMDSPENLLLDEGGTSKWRTLVSAPSPPPQTNTCT